MVHLSFFRFRGLLLALPGLLAAPAAVAQTGIGTTAPNPKAALDISASDKGLLIPRMDSATRAAIAAPLPDGLMVFQTDGRRGFWYAVSNQWVFIPDKARAGDNLGNHRATQIVSLDDNLLLLRAPTDFFHGLRFSNGVGGPQLYGNFGGQLGFWDGSAAVPVLHWTNGRRVGINTTAPTTALDVRWPGSNANLGLFQSAGGFGQILVSNGTTTTDIGVATGIGYAGTNSAGDFVLRTGALGRLYIRDGSGNIGIGLNSTNPLARLDIKSGANFDGLNDQVALAFSWRSEGFRHFVRSRHNQSNSRGNALDFYLNNPGQTAEISTAPGVGNTLALTLDNPPAGPRVGVGVSTGVPLATLHVGGAASTVRVDGLAGTGTRVVSVAPDGTLSTQTAASLADNLGNHTATQALNLQANALTGTGANLGTAVGIGVRADGGLNIGQNTPGGNLMLGFQAGAAVTTGINNHFVGYLAGQSNTTGVANHFEGYLAGRDNTSGWQNYFSGPNAGLFNTTGSQNHYSGFVAGRAATTANLNTFVGYAAGSVTTTGGNNLFVGGFSGNANLTGTDNTYLGTNSGFRSTASRNVFVGFNSGITNVGGHSNTALGFLAGPSSASLKNAAAVGYKASVSQSNSLVLGGTDSLAVRVGIGTTAPNFQFEVRTAATNATIAQFRSAGGFGQILVSNSTTTSDLGASNGIGWTGTNSGGDFVIRTSAAGRMFFQDGTGFVGIANQAPTARLHITTTGDTEQGLRLSNGSTSNIGLQTLGGGFDGYMALNFNGFFDGGQQRYNTAKFNWRLFADQRGTADELSLEVLGTTDTRIFTALPNGNLGVGVNSPQARLHTSGTVRHETLAGTGTRVVVADANGTLSAQTLPAVTGDNLGNHTATTNLAMSGNQILNTGSVAIGTGTATQRLTVAGNSAGNDGITLRNTGTGNAHLRWEDGATAAGLTLIKSWTAAGRTGLALWDGVSNVLTMRDNRIGIGTETPTRKLHVVATTGADGALISGGAIPVSVEVSNAQGSANLGVANSSGEYSNLADPGDAVLRTNAGNLILSARSNGNMLFTNGAPADVERMRLTATGRLGIGTNNPSQLLDVNGQIRIRGGAPALGRVLTSDADGNATWQAAPGGFALPYSNAPGSTFGTGLFTLAGNAAGNAMWIEQQTNNGAALVLRNNLDEAALRIDRGTIRLNVRDEWTTTGGGTQTVEPNASIIVFNNDGQVTPNRPVAISASGMFAGTGQLIWILNLDPDPLTVNGAVLGNNQMRQFVFVAGGWRVLN